MLLWFTGTMQCFCHFDSMKSFFHTVIPGRGILEIDIDIQMSYSVFKIQIVTLIVLEQGCILMVRFCYAVRGDFKCGWANDSEFFGLGSTPAVEC